MDFLIMDRTTQFPKQGSDKLQGNFGIGCGCSRNGRGNGRVVAYQFENERCRSIYRGGREGATPPTAIPRSGSVRVRYLRHEGITFRFQINP